MCVKNYNYKEEDKIKYHILNSVFLRSDGKKYLL